MAFCSSEQCDAVMQSATRVLRVTTERSVTTTVAATVTAKVTAPMGNTGHTVSTRFAPNTVASRVPG